MYMERYGLRVFCLRIGAVRANDDPTAATANPLIDLDAEGRRNRLRAVWLSRRDCAELIGGVSTSRTCPGQSSTASRGTRAVSGI